MGGQHAQGSDVVGGYTEYNRNGEESQVFVDSHSTQEQINGIFHVKPMHHCQGTFTFFFGVEEMMPAGREETSAENLQFQIGPW